MQCSRWQSKVLPNYKTTPRFDGRLQAIRLVDERLADAILEECAFFERTERPRPGYDGPGQADVRRTDVCGLYGEVLATLYVLLKDGTMTFFDIPFMQPKDDTYS